MWKTTQRIVSRACGGYIRELQAASKTTQLPVSRACGCKVAYVVEASYEECQIQHPISTACGCKIAPLKRAMKSVNIEGPWLSVSYIVEASYEECQKQHNTLYRQVVVVRKLRCWSELWRMSNTAQHPIPRVCGCEVATLMKRVLSKTEQNPVSTAWGFKIATFLKRALENVKKEDDALSRGPVVAK